ncbi:histone-lysine N-methyltransferase SMYD3 isoform X2 [Procambarus clarkii]|uniref:histone-lysine N-methyltransferase SMYD3 isoform X2 n=1 Tax=Procambarus clarkii TaxID=6728 RepID=UPI001E676F81|nr:histone-lysine N-methyltransferase SMYD3-like isoform X2 [Procambarus clarkii]
MRQLATYPARKVMDQQKVAKGNILLTATPFVHVLSGSLKGLYCDYCLKKKQENLQRCSGCKAECYCNKDCQRGSWDIHRFECKNLQRIYPLIPPDTAKLIAKVIFRLKTGGDRVEEKVTERTRRKFKDLMNHYTDLKTDKKRQEHLTSLVVVLGKYIGAENLPNEVDLQGIYGRICVNSFSITDPDLNTVGTGVYLAASVFDHSCQPNAYVTFEGTRLTCRSLVDMPCLDFAKIRISYIDVMNSTMDRKNELHRRYYFWCDCKFCHDPERDRLMSSINCGNASCTAPVLIDEDDDIDAPIGACTECGYNNLSTETRRKYCSIANHCREQLETMKDKYYLDVCRRALEMQGNLFYKLNLLCVKLQDAAFEAAIGVENWSSALEYGIKNIEGVKFYYGENHPNIGLILLKLGKICNHEQKLEDAIRYFREAEPIIRISHGTAHPTYKELMCLTQQAHEEREFLSRKKKRINNISVVGAR